MHLNWLCMVVSVRPKCDRRPIHTSHPRVYARARPHTLMRANTCVHMRMHTSTRAHTYIAAHAHLSAKNSRGTATVWRYTAQHSHGTKNARVADGELVDVGAGLNEQRGRPLVGMEKLCARLYG